MFLRDVATWRRRFQLFPSTFSSDLGRQRRFEGLVKVLQRRLGVGTIDNGTDRPARARPTLSLLKRRNGTAQFVPNPLSLFHANPSCSSALDTVERSSVGA